MIKDLFYNKTFIKYLTFFSALFTFVLLIVFLSSVIKANDFFAAMEDRTFDLRQTMLANSGHKKVNKDIVVLAIDDASYEYMLEKYGEWPIPRNVYADMVHYIEKQKPLSIAFDLMFVKSMKSNYSADAALVEIFKKYDNVYTAMNFDNQSSDVRVPINLPKKLTVKVKNDSKINYFKDLTFYNCRAILKDIIKATKNVGLINVSRSSDGVLRKMPPFVMYQNEYYPHLALKVGLDYLNKKENLHIQVFNISENADLKIGKRVVPIDSDGGAILNWYGASGNTFKEVPMYKVIKAMNGDKSVETFDFKNKIVYVGTTAVSLFDTKSVPIGQIYPGVEVHATYVNNLIDNNFIRKIDNKINMWISLALAIFIGLVVMRTSSTIISLGTTILTSFGYVILSYYLMKFLNLWVGIVMPIMIMLLVFIAAYIVKYLMKSRDFEQQYKLATTDGLTELYNHRYFQEQMLMQIENCKRYNSQFSLILIDIDFFKKFNDTYGHQAGDAVLKQVAQTLKKNVRSTDIVCRYGGEEMSIILSNTDKDEAIITAQKICQAVAAKPYKLSADTESNVTISLGVSTFPQDGSIPSVLIENADNGLYKAKENGRNQVGL